MRFEVISKFLSILEKLAIFISAKKGCSLGFERSGIG